MRALLFLLAAAIGLAFAAGRLWISLTVEPPAPVTREGLDRLVAGFLAAGPPVAEVVLGELMQRDGAGTLLDPAMQLPRTHVYRPEEIRAVSTAAAACSFEGVGRLEDPHLKKAVVWHRRLCGEGTLDPAFFTQPPYLHLSGVSYVSLARARGLSEASGAPWLTANLRYAHAGELAGLIASVPGLEVEAGRRVLAALGADALRALVAGERVLLGPEHLLVLEEDVGPGPQVYRAYARSGWNEWLSETPYRLARHVEGVACLARVGSLCWQLDVDGFRERTMLTLGLQLAGLIGVAMLAAILLLRGVRERVAEAERRRFMLQVMAHEIRTPLASLSVSLESLRASFDGLPEGAQVALLRMCDDRQRLSRVVEASRQYLRADELGRLLQLQPVRLESAAEWLADVVERAGGGADSGGLVDGARPEGVRLEGPVPGGALNVDPYWLEMCVVNLVANARRHGRPPVIVRARRDSGHFVIEVEDAGRCEFATLEEMARPYTRGGEGQGLGLGLALVRAVAGQMGGGLAFSGGPTRFTLSIKEAS